ncbi:MAG: transglycosylase domain-containing protein [Paenisporosarcina sp.]
MRQSIGFILIVGTLPTLVFLYSQIGKEIQDVSQFQTVIDSSIQLTEPTFPSPVTMKDQNGHTFSEEYIEWRKPLPINEIPLVAQELFIQSEDADFYQHIGFDLSAIVRAVVANSSTQENTQGGSTITQQLVRMRYLTDEKTYERKVTELLYAYELEQLSSKEKILEMYLNEMYFSNQVYGIGAAATFYFQKELAQCSEAEMAFLAAIPNNPSLYDPLKNFDETKRRQELLLDVLASKGSISLEQAEVFKAQSIVLKTKQKVQQFPAYSTYVIEELNKLIAEKDGFSQRLEKATTPSEKDLIATEIKKKLDEVLSLGVTIETSLDPRKQKSIDLQFNQQLEETDIQAAGIVIDNKAREIIGLFGGKNYRKFDFNRAYQASRQPGSAIKPLLVYAPFFETTAYSPDTIVNGGKYCLGTFCPQNYGGAIYGDVTLQQAFRFSYNTPAVRLFESIGVEKAFHYLDPFQFTEITQEDWSLPAAIGGFNNGVTPLQMADAYTSFIDGQYQPVHAIRFVKDKSGKIIYEWDQEKEEVWKQTTVQYLRMLMKDVVENGTGKGISGNSLYIGAKTGTTNDYHDFWLAGLTEEYTATVWIGYDLPQNMKSIESKKIHHSLFNELIKR